MMFSCCFFNVHSITLQLLVNSEYLTTNLGSEAKQSRFTSDYTRNHVYILHNYTKSKHFHCFLEFPPCQYIETNLLEKNSL